MILTDRFLSLIGMARKANRVSLGYEMALDAVHSGKSRVVFYANDLSEKTARGLVFAGENFETTVTKIPYSIFELTNAVGSKTGVVSINDAGFAKKLILLLDEQNRNAD